MKLRWKIACCILYLPAKWFFRVKIVGQRNIPKKGGCILASNHISYLDPPLVGLMAKREVYYLAKEGLFKEVDKLFTYLITAFNAVPLTREGADLKAIKTILGILKRGEVVVIFPEGTRSKTGKLLPAKPGIGFIARMAKVPIIPVLIKGASEKIKDILLRKRRIIIHFGLPFSVDSFGRDYDAMGKEIMKRIADLNI